MENGPDMEAKLMVEEQDIFITDAQHHISNLRDLSNWIHTVYYADSLSAFFNRPVVSMLETAVTFLIDNLSWLCERYLAEKE